MERAPYLRIHLGVMEPGSPQVRHQWGRSPPLQPPNLSRGPSPKTEVPPGSVCRVRLPTPASHRHRYAGGAVVLGILFGILTALNSHLPPSRVQTQTLLPPSTSTPPPLHKTTRRKQPRPENHDPRGIHLHAAHPLSTWSRRWCLTAPLFVFSHSCTVPEVRGPGPSGVWGPSQPARPRRDRSKPQILQSPGWWVQRPGERRR